VGDPIKNLNECLQRKKKRGETCLGGGGGGELPPKLEIGTKKSYKRAGANFLGGGCMNAGRGGENLGGRAGVGKATKSEEDRQTPTLKGKRPGGNGVKLTDVVGAPDKRGSGGGTD